MIFLTVIIVFIIDLSGFIDSLKRGLSYLLTKGRIIKSDYSLKPFDCSLCMTFWCGIVYFLIIGKLSLLSIMYVSLCSFFTPVIKDILYFLRDSFIKILSKWTD